MTFRVLVVVAFVCLGGSAGAETWTVTRPSSDTIVFRKVPLNDPDRFALPMVKPLTEEQIQAWSTDVSEVCPEKNFIPKHKERASCRIDYSRIDASIGKAQSYVTELESSGPQRQANQRVDPIATYANNLNAARARLADLREQRAAWVQRESECSAREDELERAEEEAQAKGAAALEECRAAFAARLEQRVTMVATRPIGELEQIPTALRLPEEQERIKAAAEAAPTVSAKPRRKARVAQ